MTVSGGAAVPGIDLQLSVGGSIGGRVSGWRDGQGLLTTVGSSVEAYTPSGVLAGTGKVDSSLGYVIEGLAAMCPDLAMALLGIVERLVDLYPVTKASYYHPDMLGSWSIKAVLPTIAPDMDYARLEGIQEGNAASAAYLEAIDTQTTPQRKEEIRTELLKYCKHDTEAMVRLMQFFSETRA